METGSHVLATIMGTIGQHGHKKGVIIMSVSRKTLLSWGNATWGNGRIPAIDYHKNSGTLLIATGCRTVLTSDLPNGAKVGFMKSTNNVSSFSTLKQVINIGDVTGVDDPCIVVNQDTGRIFIFCTSAESVIDNSVKAPWSNKCNIYWTYSDDLGETWASQRKLTLENELFSAVHVISSGSGIYIPELNRIIIPTYGYKNSEETHASFIYTDNDGATWHQGGEIGDSSGYIGEHRIIYSQGELISIGRTVNGELRADYRSSDNGTSWTAYTPSNKKILNDVGVNFGLETVQYKGKEYWFYVSCDMPSGYALTDRRYGKLFVSTNRGKTWRAVYRITSNFKDPSNFFAYVDMCASNNKLFILYETDDYRKLNLLTIDISDLLG